MKAYFIYIGLTPGNGRIYVKNKARIVVYNNSKSIKYWPEFNDGKGTCYERTSNGYTKKPY